MKEEILKKLLEYAESTASFIGEELPEIFRQVVSYGMLRSFIFCLPMLGMIIFGVAGVKVIGDEEDTGEFNNFLFLAAIFLVIGGGIGLYYGVVDILKALMAPKLYILDYLRGT